MVQLQGTPTSGEPQEQAEARRHRGRHRSGWCQRRRFSRRDGLQRV